MRKVARQTAFLVIYEQEFDKGEQNTTDVSQDATYVDALLDMAEVRAQLPEAQAQSRLLSADDRTFMQSLVEVTRTHMSDIDAVIEGHSQNWRVPRMPSTDRNILRVGVAEMLFSAVETDTAVIINEYVELAKVYGNDDSYKFINAVLDAIVEQRPAHGD